MRIYQEISVIDKLENSKNIWGGDSKPLPIVDNKKNLFTVYISQNYPKDYLSNTHGSVLQEKQGAFLFSLFFRLPDKTSHLFPILLSMTEEALVNIISSTPRENLMTFRESY